MGRINFDFLSSDKPSRSSEEVKSRTSVTTDPALRPAVRGERRTNDPSPSTGARWLSSSQPAGSAERVSPTRPVYETTPETAGADWPEVIASLRSKLEGSARTAAEELTRAGARVPGLARTLLESARAGIQQVQQASSERRSARNARALRTAGEQQTRATGEQRRAVNTPARRRRGLSRWQGLAVLSSLALAVGLTGLRAASKEEVPPAMPAMPPTFTEAAQEFSTPQTAKRSIPGMTSRSYVVVDAATKEILVAKDADQARSIASLTKLMSSMVYLDLAPDLNEVIEIKAEDRKGARPAHTRLQKGWKLTSNDLLHAALIASENPAVEALARSTGLTKAEFVGMMNRKAQELGMTSSIFFDVSGLDSGNMASAVDVARMVDAAGKYPLIHEIDNMAGYEATVLNSGRKLAYVNSNRLARYGSFEVVAGKTGYISDAGYCLTLSIRQGGRELLMAFLNSHSKAARFADATRAAAWVAEYAPTAVASNP